MEGGVEAERRVTRGPSVRPAEGVFLVRDRGWY